MTMVILLSGCGGGGSGNVLNDSSGLENKLGIWEGIGEQTQGSWSIRIDIGRLEQSIEYPSLNCAGDLELIEDSGNRLLFRESITFGIEACTSDGFIELTDESESVLNYNWYLTEESLNQNQPDGWGTVSRVQSNGSPPTDNTEEEGQSEAPPPPSGGSNTPKPQGSAGVGHYRALGGELYNTIWWHDDGVYVEFVARSEPNESDHWVQFAITNTSPYSYYAPFCSIEYMVGSTVVGRDGFIAFYYTNGSVLKPGEYQRGIREPLPFNFTDHNTYEKIRMKKCDLNYF